ncbi:hypothetical protein GC197_08035 [bacterium]|nr:hypothetical protein [bacterium]
MRTLLILSISLVCLTGCLKQGSPPPVVKPAASTVTQEDPAPTPTVREVSIESAAVPEAGIPFDLEPTVEPQKLLLFTSEGPYRVDVRLWIDDQPYDQALESLVDYVIDLADTNKDGTATWDELADQPEIRAGQFGNLSFEDPRQRKQNIDRYDTNRNGWVDRSEVPRLVSRSGARTEAFSVRRTSYAADRSRSDSPLRQLLDKNGNGTIEPDEIIGANALIRQRDLDDDEIVSPMELLAASGRSDDDMTRSGDRRRFFGGQAMFTLDDRTPWNELLYAMQEIYEHGANLDLSRFPAENLLHAIDSDGNGALNLEELKAIPDLPPHYELTIHFGKRGEASRIKLASVDKPASEVLADDNEVALELGKDWLVFRARDNVENQYSSQQAENLLRIYDNNQDGYLKKDELPEQGTPINFELADKDGNEKLYPEEIEATLSQQNWFRRCHIRLQGIEGDDPLFRALDPNHDQKLSARELGQLDKMLQAIDSNRSSSVEFDEIPSLIVFEFFRGDQDNPGPVPVMPMEAAMVQTNGNAPAWFTGMDYNGDGDISPREFLGTSDQFQQLDLDKDGFLTIDEATSSEVDQ